MHRRQGEGLTNPFFRLAGKHAVTAHGQRIGKAYQVLSITRLKIDQPAVGRDRFGIPAGAHQRIRQ